MILEWMLERQEQLYFWS